MTMTIDDIEQRIAGIRAIARDDEAAHRAEDSLREDVLHAIAHGTCEDPQRAAKLAISTGEIDFCRWCA